MAKNIGALTRIKVCGMTQAQQAAAAVRLGVDAIGMIMHANSPRQVTLEQARAIRQCVPAFVSLVGVYVDAEVELINQHIHDVGLDLVQLHGQETPTFASQLDRPYINAVRARTSDQIADEIAAHGGARAVLLDPYVKGQHGGTGQQLDSRLWPSGADVPLILAGGLNADNVGAAIAKLRPYAVDFNSGVEIEPGNKDLGLLADAIDQVRR